MAYTFAAQARVGTWGETQAMAYYRLAGRRVVDLSADVFYQVLDIDCYVAGLGLVEIKADTYDSGNLYIERVSNTTKDSRGCLMYTAADWIFYYFVTQGRAVLLPVPELQEWAAHRLLDFPEKRPRTARANGDFAYESIGHPVPEATLLAEVPGAHILTGLPVLSR